MATQIQYKFFKGIYEEENLRYKQLAARAKFYFTIQTVYLAALAFKFDDIKTLANALTVPLVLFIAIGLLLVLGVLFTLLATRIQDYEGPANLKKIIKSMDSAPQSDSDFLDDRLVDYAVAAERNSEANDKTANWLTMTGWTLFAAISLHFLTFVWAYINQIKL
jgi:hypothetical protein